VDENYVPEWLEGEECEDYLFAGMDPEVRDWRKHYFGPSEDDGTLVETETGLRAPPGPPGIRASEAEQRPRNLNPASSERLAVLRRTMRERVPASLDDERYWQSLDRQLQLDIVDAERCEKWIRWLEETQPVR
jgi:hypothetical protein